MKPLRVYLRLIHSKNEGKDCEQETLALTNFLSSLPDIRLLKPINLHPRGGYCTSFELGPNDLEHVIQLLEAKGYRGVL